MIDFARPIGQAYRMPYTKKTGPFQTAVAHGPNPIRLHYITLVGAVGSVAVDYTLSSPGMTAIRTNVGRYTISFPAGGAQARGWVECSLLNPSVQGALLQAWAAPADFVLGTAQVRLLSAAGSGADLVGQATFSVMCLCDHSNN